MKNPSGSPDSYTNEHARPHGREDWAFKDVPSDLWERCSKDHMLQMSELLKPKSATADSSRAHLFLQRMKKVTITTEYRLELKDDEKPGIQQFPIARGLTDRSFASTVENAIIGLFTFSRRLYRKTVQASKRAEAMIKQLKASRNTPTGT